MSDDNGNNTHDNDLRRELDALNQEPAQPGVIINIVMDAAGNTRVNFKGTSHLYLLYGALEMAKDVVRKWHAEQHQSRIHTVTPSLPDDFMGRKV